MTVARISRRSAGSAPAARAARAASSSSSRTPDRRSACSSAAVASRTTSGSGCVVSSSSRSCRAVRRLRNWCETSPTRLRSRWTSSASAPADVSRTSETRSSSGIPCRSGVRRKSPAPSRAARSATSRSGSASRRAVTVATTAPVPTDSTMSSTTTSVTCTCSVRSTVRGSASVIDAPGQTGSVSAIGSDPTSAPRNWTGRPASSSVSRPPEGTASASASWSTVSNEPGPSSREATCSSRSSRSARLKSSISRQVVMASGTPSTSAVIVTTSSVDCRMRRRTGTRCQSLR